MSEYFVSGITVNEIEMRGSWNSNKIPVEFYSHVLEVIVNYMPRMAGWSELTEHEDLFCSLYNQCWASKDTWFFFFISFTTYLMLEKFISTVFVINLVSPAAKTVFSLFALT